MGHSVDYMGSLKFKNPLTEEQEKFIETCQNNGDDYDRFYALELNKDKSALEYEDSDKIYPDSFYCSIKKFAENFKKLGNDFEEGSYLLSCSEYGIGDSETILFAYINGEFIEKHMIEIIDQYIKYLQLKN